MKFRLILYYNQPQDKTAIDFALNGLVLKYYISMIQVCRKILILTFGHRRIEFTILLPLPELKKKV